MKKENIEILMCINVALVVIMNVIILAISVFIDINDSFLYWFVLYTLVSILSAIIYVDVN